MEMTEIKVLGLDGFHKNSKLHFNANGVEVVVSLNIEPGMVKYMSPNNVFKGEKFFLYSLRKHIDSRFICAKTLMMVQNELLKRCKISCRKAKISMLEKQVSDLGNGKD